MTVPLYRLRGGGRGPRSGRVRVFFFASVEKKKTLTQPSPMKMGEG